MLVMKQVILNLVVDHDMLILAMGSQTVSLSTYCKIKSMQLVRSKSRHTFVGICVRHLPIHLQTGLVELLLLTIIIIGIIIVIVHICV